MHNHIQIRERRYGSYLHMVVLSGPSDGLDWQVGSALNETCASRGNYCMSGRKRTPCIVQRMYWRASGVAGPPARDGVELDRWSVLHVITGPCSRVFHNRNPRDGKGCLGSRRCRTGRSAARQRRMVKVLDLLRPLIRKMYVILSLQLPMNATVAGFVVEIRVLCLFRRRLRPLQFAPHPVVHGTQKMLEIIHEGSRNRNWVLCDLEFSSQFGIKVVNFYFPCTFILFSFPERKDLLYI